VPQPPTPSAQPPASLGLYVHIPFCSAICNYCNFNRGLFDGALKARYIEALIDEIRQAGLKACTTTDVVRTLRSGDVAFDPTTDVVQASGTADIQADTIFFGGGTPSLLEPAEIQRIIAACETSFDVGADREVTLEANPESVTEERLAAYRAAGVNRLSFGVQSFRDDELEKLSRLHGAARARAAYGEARRAGFDNISLDLMMWLPGQRLEAWLESIEAAVALGPEHLSLYLLEVYPNAPLKDLMARSRWSQAPDEDAAAMYLAAMERLDAAGYVQYEISNVARAGRSSRHNLKYWRDGAWLGFGCGAHSTHDGIRWKNVAGIEEYVDRIGRGQPAAIDVRRLSAGERLGDALFMALRLTDGVNLDEIRRRYGVDVWDRYGPELEPFVQNGCLMRDCDRLRLTRRGMLLANEVMTVFV
jgi:oxygen-independent coproporphyrinogen-3 oxidase